ncbi:MAG: coenzyme F420-0:L-glutamate ligase [Candidatus Colwellbacteria bacterium]|nr:coenzyme F420-0:L-glutamate ligase [Candidatus Colwellbacteria bacterium]
MVVEPIKTRVFKESESLVPFIKKNVLRLPERSILVITQKIVSLSEGRIRELENERTRDKIIKEESDLAIRTKYTWLTIKDGTVMSSAGVDESNANGKLVLLPRDSFASAARIRKELQKIYKVKRLGVLITDSRLLPLRAGVVGVALGYAGFKGVRDYRGKPDIFGRKLKLSRTDVADSLATAAVLEMGEAAEQQPIAIIKNAQVEFTERVNRKELHIDPKDDVYAPMFKKVLDIKFEKKKKTGKL